MSGVEGFAAALGELKRHPGTYESVWTWTVESVIPLLDSVLVAWVQAEAVGAGESESRRWSDVCTAALDLLARYGHVTDEQVA